MRKAERKARKGERKERRKERKAERKEMRYERRERKHERDDGRKGEKDLERRESARTVVGDGMSEMTYVGDTQGQEMGVAAKE